MLVLLDIINLLPGGWFGGSVRNTDSCTIRILHLNKGYFLTSVLMSHLDDRSALSLGTYIVRPYFLTKEDLG